MNNKPTKEKPSIREIKITEINNEIFTSVTGFSGIEVIGIFQVLIQSKINEVLKAKQ